MTTPESLRSFLSRIGVPTMLLMSWMVATAGWGADHPVTTTSTWCNPLSIPNYPLGRSARDVNNTQSSGEDILWLLGHKEQFRELADPTVLFHDNVWYMYPSVDMAWLSRDRGATWEHHPLNIRDVGYAPTVVRHHGRFLLIASTSLLYASDSPLGPFVPLGPITLPSAAHAPLQIDPMLFSDDDGRLYYYWGCSRIDGIWGAELDANNPTTLVSKPRQLIPFSPDEQPWQRCGEANQDRSKGFLEGSWMLKHDGRYYLTYSAAGTENRTYAMGCATSASPLGTFVAQRRNPIFRNTAGLVTGTAHGCIVPGPDGGLWAFYTIRAGHVHGFERRLGMDRAWFDANGELAVSPATEIPQRLPGNAPLPAEQSAAGWEYLNLGQLTVGSSVAGSLAGRFATDDELRTWWQPYANDAEPTLTCHLPKHSTVHSIRLIWRDIGLDTFHQVNPGAFRYRVDIETTPDQWATLIDRSTSTEDLLIDYRECQPTAGTRIRLVILGSPAGITPGVAEFSAFGATTPAAGK